MADWPLVGRADETMVLRDLLTGAQPRSVVLAGPAGVGKTRLGQEGLALAERAGLATAQASATRSAAQVPFGAVAPLLPGAPPEPGVVDDRVDLLRRSVAALAERSDGHPLLLFVDDAHLLDDASATLVHQAAATGAAVVLATVTTGEPAPDPVVALWKDGLAERIELGTLDGDATGELLATMLSGPVDPAAAAQFAERSQGNAQFLRELVVGAIDDGGLDRNEDGTWRLGHELSPSARLVEIVEAHLGRLDDRERRLMELVAYGEPLGPEELDRLSDPLVAEALERRGLLATRLDGRRLRVHLAHPLYGDVVRTRTPALRVRAIARELAEAVGRTGAGRQEDALRVATWHLLAGDGKPGVLLAGAGAARWRYDFPLAERLAAAAATAGAGFDAALLSAQLASLQGRREEAEEALAALAAEATDDTQRGQVAVSRFDNAYTGAGDDGVQVLDEAERTTRDPAWRDRLDARRLAVLHDTDGPRAAVEAAEPLLDHARDEALIAACLAGAFALGRVGRLDDAIAVSDRGIAARQAIEQPLAWYPWWHTVTRGHALLHAGRFAEAEDLAAAQHAAAVADGSAEAQAVFALLAAGSVGERGRVRTAARRAREALALDQQLGRLRLVRQDRMVAALALALAGEGDEAEEELAALDALGLPPGWRDEVDLLQARAWTAAAGGDIPRAGEHLDHAAAAGEEVGDLVGLASALHGLARLGHAADVTDRLAEVATRIDGELAPARARHTAALAADDAEELEEVSVAFEAMGADLLAAEASADAAVVRRRAGLARESTAAERRTAALVERAEGPVTPALQATEVRARLTPAERETAVLAAAGRSNKDIAEHLYLSPRTVENRLQRVYEKLGVAGRTELADALAVDA